MLKDQLPPCQGEHIGVLTPNIIAGLIANRLNLMGPSYIVDAACATTMIALESAVRELNSGRCDLMLVGGSQAHTPPQIFMQRSEEHTSELQSLMRISYAVFCLKKKIKHQQNNTQ